MTMWSGWLERIATYVLEPSRDICTICGEIVSTARHCENCGVVVCTTCSNEGVCPYCGEPL
ncbi:MAG TPA: hypothetical protein PK140_04455 [Polyangiaceae bacterium]|nr:hypothetical protein [Polyangiaceae bacterium]HQM08623.1 hypothetical protein [Polyangiaceae bacterium]